MHKPLICQIHINYNYSMIIDIFYALMGAVSSIKKKIVSV